MSKIVILITLLCNSPETVTLKQNNQIVWQGSYTEAMADKAWVKKMKQHLSEGRATLVVYSKKEKCL